MFFINTKLTGEIMSNKVKEVWDLILKGVSLNEIQQLYNFDCYTFSSILKSIKDSGFNLRSSYYDTGKIIVSPQKKLELYHQNKIRINLETSTLRTLFISDLHIGSIFERTALLETVYDYAKSHDIHIIFNTGDVIENIYEDHLGELKNKTLESQVRKVLKVYPYDPNIVNFIVYGNHDYKSVLDSGFDIARYLQQMRYDLVSLGYGTAEILLNNDSIALVHNLKKMSTQPAIQQAVLTFKGHSHKSKNSIKENKIIYVPSLSEYRNTTYEYRPLVCFLDVEFVFVDKKIERVNIKQLAIIKKEIRLANEEALVLRPNKKFHNFSN